jgi:N-methylhydantoinase A
MHAARLAEELEIERVVCPRGAGVLSAVGLVVTGARRDLAQSVLLDEARLQEGAAAAAVSALARRAHEELPGAALEAAYDLRYRGQAFELTVPGPLDASPAFLRERFEAQHEERYGYVDRHGELEVVNVRVAATADAPESGLALAAPTGAVERGSRPGRFAGEEIEAAVLRGDPPAGTRVEGPAIVELPEATAVIPPRWSAAVDAHGTLTMERAG